MKFIVCALICFGLYSGYCFMPAYTVQSQFENLIAHALETGTHKLKAKAIRDKTLQAARSESIELEKDDIEIHREPGEGERTIHVAFQLPVTISYLGSERTLLRSVHVSRTYPVDEAAEARLVAQQENRRRTAKEEKRRGRAEAADYYGRISDKCAESTSREFTATGVLITGAKGGIKTVKCSDARRLSKKFGDR